MSACIAILSCFKNSLSHNASQGFQPAELIPPSSNYHNRDGGCTKSHFVTDETLVTLHYTQNWASLNWHRLSKREMAQMARLAHFPVHRSRG